ncbi:MULTISPECIES: TonB-dependent hemoglobin/transferrin/lactoferrin family receptor [Photorhabdus]|uniref:TonB-dependent hemoglobin/transferrin/lactoferrin family receptor n=1 Tax=Photorhabdus TaxID=29487 RepID=UPI000DCD8CD2|nr:MULTISPECIES: TonB-dependent hemoglobin/transferrin/lactoferrin family receptor [Photorhabdus]MCT8345214.1 TonB-dependent hemoglobin/transferrin/lactoferrin family receptor [Photorhabdus kleinii]RAW96687.1 TonB-dependent receptor [Photorhabdus sp. S10-54]RAW96885.1 TonB-dependent receptor [Photorhabdus sp. S9-53]RAX01195.1 TonB-dependent receptor [Photorhabdus sp. S8-52]
MKNSGKPQKTSATATTQPINRTLHYALSSIIMLSTGLPGYLAAQENGEQKSKEKPEKSEKVITLSTLSVIGGLNNSVSAGSSVLKKEDIERTQADNIAELLDQLPGVSMSGSPRPGGQTLNIWGMGDTEDVKVTLDDAPKGFEKYRQGSIFIEPELIKRVDVDKGPHNLLDGNGGFGGTVKVVTKDASDLLRPGEDFGGLLKYSYHTNDRQNIYSSAVYGRTIEGFADGLLYMSKRDGGNIKRPDGTRFAFSKSDQASYLLKTNFYLNDANTLTLSAMRSDSDGWQPWAAKRDEIVTPSEAHIKKYGWDEAWRRKLVYRDQTDQNYTAKWNIAPEDNPLLNLTATYAYSKTEQHDKRPVNAGAVASIGNLGNESWIDYVDNLVDINNKMAFMTGAIEHTLLTGVRWHKNQRNTLMYYKNQSKNPAYNYGYFQPYQMPSGKQETHSFYLQDAMTIGSVTVTPGIRYDHIKNTGKENIAAVYNDKSPKIGHDYSSVTYTGWSPHLGIMWKATQNLSLFSDISHTWRAPLVDEQYEVQYAQSSVTATSRNLDVERMTGLRFGAILDFNNLLTAQDSLQIRTTLFYNRGKDEIFTGRSKIHCKAQANGAPESACSKPLPNYRNLPGYSIQGLEIETFYDSSYLFGKFSFSTIRGQRDTSPINPWWNRKTWLRDIPPTSAHTMLGVKIPQWQMAVGWTGDFIRKQDRSPTDGDPDAGHWALPKSKGYALHGLFASWQPNFWQGLEARVTVNNLFNRDYRPYLSESVSGIGRNIKFSISQKF